MTGTAGDASAGGSGSSAGDISICTYNVLGQTLALSKYFPYVDKAVLKQAKRWASILQVLQAIATDVFCLQEMDRWDDFIEPKMKALGYAGLFKDRLSETCTKKDGVAILWRDARFELVREHRFDLNALAGEMVAAGVHPDHAARFKRDNVCLVVVLRERSTGRRIVVATSHLFWDPAYPDVKLEQAARVLREASQIADEARTPGGPPVPLVVAGDFNSMPDSAVYALYSRGRYEADPASLMSDEQRRTVPTSTAEAPPPPAPGAGGPWLLSAAAFEAPAALRSAYAAYCPAGEPPFTNYTQNFKGCLDYVWYSAPLEVRRLVDLPGEGEVGVHVALPNHRFPSDHLPIGSVFRWT